MPDPDRGEPDLVEQLRRRVTEWVTRVAPRIRDHATAKLEILLHQPQEDEISGALYLDFEIVETTVPGNGGGCVPGVMFEHPAGSP